MSVLRIRRGKGEGLANPCAQASVNAAFSLSPSDSLANVEAGKATRRARQQRQMITNLLIITVFPAAMALAAATDLFTMTVPNRIALLLVAGFAVPAPLVGLGWQEIGLHVALAAADPTEGEHGEGHDQRRGGDAKLFAATCLW